MKEKVLKEEAEIHDGPEKVPIRRGPFPVNIEIIGESIRDPRARGRGVRMGRGIDDQGEIVAVRVIPRAVGAEQEYLREKEPYEDCREKYRLCIRFHVAA